VTAKLSAVWKLLLSLGAACLIFGCGSAAKAPVEGRSLQAKSSSAFHSVRKGETLYAIAWAYGVDHKDVAAWNGIRTPYLIYPGQRLRLRGPKRTTARAKSPAPPSAKSSKSTTSTAAPRPAPRTTSPKAGPISRHGVKRSNADAAKRLVWTWPAQGTVIKEFGDGGSKGLDISGKRGQPVYCAGAGRVVYSGSGLLGYGKLIIVKHNKNYLSAYAHNDKLLVKEGDKVAGGQRIAQMGSSGVKQVKLHFEIRRDGRPVDPLRYLPST